MTAFATLWNKEKQCWNNYLILKPESFGQKDFKSEPSFCLLNGTTRVPKQISIHFAFGQFTVLFYDRGWEVFYRIFRYPVFEIVIQCPLIINFALLLKYL